MGIKQLNGTYLPAEDRILFRVSTDAQEEFRFWLTRPVTRRLLAEVDQSAAQTVAQKFPQEIAQTVTEFQREALHAQTKLDDRYEPGSTFPLGEVPTLVVDLKIAAAAHEMSIDLVLPNQRNVNLRVAHDLAQRMCVLLDRLQKAAGWGLDAAAVPAPPGSGAVAAESDGKKIVH
jgi:hypothetical protein